MFVRTRCAFEGFLRFAITSEVPTTVLWGRRKSLAAVWLTIDGCSHLLLEFAACFYLMPTRDEFLVAELQSTSESVSQNKRFRASIIVWGMPKSLSTRAKLADIGLASFARGSVAWEGDHVRLLLLPKGLSNDVVGRISACLRKIGCRCVLDESQKAWESAGVQVNIACT